MAVAANLPGPSMIARRSLLLATAAGIARPALAQGFPTRPLTILVPYVPGGPSDILARAVAQPLSAALGQPVVVENRPGGNGAVAAQVAMRAAPDGHTLFLAASGIMTINPHIMPRLAYDPLRDFAPITVAITAPNLLVANPGFPPATVPDFIAWLRANPGKASFGSSGIGSSEQLTMELFAQQTGTALTHVPYPGGAAVVPDLISGVLQVAFLNISTVSAQVQAGALKAIATAGPQRHPLFPALPVVADTVPGFEGGSWHSIVAPRGTPEAVLDQLNAELRKALLLPEVEERLKRIGFAVEASSRADFAARLQREYAGWAAVVRRAGIAAN